jgi:hypothetical protein
MSKLVQLMMVKKRMLMLRMLMTMMITTMVMMMMMMMMCTDPLHELARESLKQFLMFRIVLNQFLEWLHAVLQIYHTWHQRQG